MQRSAAVVVLASALVVGPLVGLAAHEATSRPPEPSVTPSPVPTEDDAATPSATPTEFERDESDAETSGRRQHRRRILDPGPVETEPTADPTDEPSSEPSEEPTTEPEPEPSEPSGDSSPVPGQGSDDTVDPPARPRPSVAHTAAH